MGDSLATLLLGRLPTPVLRIDFRLLQRYCQQDVYPDLMHGFMVRPASPSIAEAELAERYAIRTSPPVLAIMERLWDAARAGLDPEDTEAGLSQHAFARFHGLLSLFHPLLCCPLPYHMAPFHMRMVPQPHYCVPLHAVSFLTCPQVRVHFR